MQKYSKLVKQLFFYGFVGGVSFLIDLVVTTSLYNYLHFPAYLAGIIGFLSAFFFNFPANRKHVFNHSSKDRFNARTQVILYGLLCLFNVLVTALFMHLFVDSGLLKIEVAKVLITVFIALWNFAIFKLWIFSKHKTDVA